MTFLNLLKHFTDFVNLGKLLVDAGPGIILAIALSMLAASVAELPVLPYSTRPVGLLQGEEAASPADESTYEENLAELREEIASRQTKIEAVSKEKAAADSRVNALTLEITELDARLKKLKEEQEKRIFSERIEGKDFSAQIAATRLEKVGKQADLDLATGEQKRIGLELDSLAADHKRLLEDFDALRESRVSNLSALFEYLLDHLIGLALIGWVLGTMMNPINRALMDQSARPDTIKKQAGVQVASFASTSPMVQAAAQAAVDSAATEQVQEAQREKQREKEKEKLLELVHSHRASYFIGRKIISQTEWDAFVTGYYRWAELAMNLVVPLIVTGLSFLLVRRARLGPGETDVLRLETLIPVVLLVAFILLAGAGDWLLKRYTSVIPNPWLRRFVSVLALVVVFVSAARLWQDAWAFAALVSWYLAILAWLRGRKGLLRFRKREVQFLLGRLETALVKEKECKEALTLKTVAATIVGEFEQLLEAVKRDRDAIKKELLENLEDCLRDQKKQKEGG